MIGYAGFVLSSSTAAMRMTRPDVVIAVSPPLSAVFPGWIASRAGKKTVPWIFEVGDLWPESAVTTGVVSATSFLTKLMYRVERAACRSAARIAILSPAFQEDIVRRGLAAANKIVFVPNGANVNFAPGPLDNDIRRELKWGNRFVATYTGAHGKANRLMQLVLAAELLKQRPDIQIACFGEGPERIALLQEAERRGLVNIGFYGARSRNEMPEVINASDAGIAVLQHNPTFRTVYPNKIFDYMACARPTALAIDGVARKLVCNEAQAGVYAEPENARELADALVWLADHPAERAEMGRRGREWVLANASRPALAARYLDVMEQLVRD
jgi:glycosyltransferase involved in cell wall biosynthesis